jgi:hypothetical protein
VLASDVDLGLSDWVPVQASRDPIETRIILPRIEPVRVQWVDSEGGPVVRRPVSLIRTGSESERPSVLGPLRRRYGVTPSRKPSTGPYVVDVAWTDREGRCVLRPLDGISLGLDWIAGRQENDQVDEIRWDGRREVRLVAAGGPDVEVSWTDMPSWFRARWALLYRIEQRAVVMEWTSERSVWTAPASDVEGVIEVPLDIGGRMQIASLQPGASRCSVPRGMGPGLLEIELRRRDLPVLVIGQEPTDRRRFESPGSPRLLVRPGSFEIVYGDGTRTTGRVLPGEITVMSR